jgi:hypothetical protein
MEEFQKYGFTPLNDDQIRELTRINPNVIPHLQRYEGMGWMLVLIEYEGRYGLAYVGGENFYTADDNFEKYRQLNSGSEWFTLAGLRVKLSNRRWSEIVSEEEVDGGIILHCVERKYQE